MAFKQVQPEALQDNFFSRLKTDWALLCAGRMDDFNSMTVSWGQVGQLWGKDVATVYVRPQRHTFGYMEREPRFALCFFQPGSHRKQLALLGSQSGRDMDKMRGAGLSPADFGGVPGYAEATLVLACTKVYRQDLDGAAFLDEALRESCYPEKDYHRMYVGRIDGVFVPE